RHTRFSRDWSSDVCSSDLIQDRPTIRRPYIIFGTTEWHLWRIVRFPFQNIYRLTDLATVIARHEGVIKMSIVESIPMQIIQIIVDDDISSGQIAVFVSRVVVFQEHRLRKQDMLSIGRKLHILQTSLHIGKLYGITSCYIFSPQLPFQCINYITIFFDFEYRFAALVLCEL